MIIELIEAQPYDDRQMVCTVDVTDDEGTLTRVAHFIPYEAAEWRIAEYDLDPADTDTVVDVLLWEAHAHADVPEELRLHAAPTVEAAREALLGAVQARKGVARASKAGPEAEARQRLIALCPVDEEVVAAKRQHVQNMRASVTAARPASPPLAADRLAALTSTEERHAIPDDNH
jgi:hypothetical protein